MKRLQLVVIPVIFLLSFRDFVLGKGNNTSIDHQRGEDLPLLTMVRNILKNLNLVDEES